MEESTIQLQETKGNLLKPLVYDLVDMIYMLSQIIVKVPLSEMFRIEEHTIKTVSWLGGIGNINIVERESSIE